MPSAAPTPRDAPEPMLPLLIALLAPPVPVAPPDDPAFAQCLPPGTGVKLRWEPGEEGLASWLLVKRRDESGEWRTWVKSWVREPPFTLLMRTRLARNGDYAWVLFGVDPEGGAFAAGDWRYFCTRE